MKYSDGNYYLDPGIPEVRQLVADGVTEIVKNYVWTASTWTTTSTPGQDSPTTPSYKTYGSAFKNADDWRRDNVNQLVKELDTAIHKLDCFRFLRHQSLRHLGQPVFPFRRLQHQRKPDLLLPLRRHPEMGEGRVGGLHLPSDLLGDRPQLGRL